jgi:hypothetical protein
MEGIDMKISCEKIPMKDKGCHLIVGFIIGILSALFIDSAFMFLPMLIAGFGKEVYDEYLGKTGFDFADLFSTVIGGTIGIMLTMFLDILFG